MMNFNLDNNAILESSVNGSSMYHKQSTIPVKKVALRDVQNDMPNSPENSFLGRPVADHIKILGTKIYSPEFPRNPSCYQFTSISGASDHLIHGKVERKLDSELGKRRVHGVTEQDDNHRLNFKRHCSQHQPELPKERSKRQERETSSVPASAPMPVASPIKFSPGKPPVPAFLGKPSNGSPAAHSRHHRYTPESVVPHLVDSERNGDEQRTEQFLHLQNLLKHFDEFDQREYIKTLRCLPPSELSRHAVELEKRSMQLSVEEAKEIQRMMALNILGKSSIQ